jgi:hypothetical protein
LNFGQTTRDKFEVLLGMSWGTTWELEEPLGNTLQTREKMKKIPLASSPKRKKLNHL